MTFVSATPGAAILGKASLQPLVTTLDDGTLFPIDNPGSANRHILVQATTTNVADAYTGCAKEVIILNFTLTGTSPCTLLWDDSNPSNPPSQLVTTVPSQIRPNGFIIFCGTQVCSDREVSGNVKYFFNYPSGQNVLNAAVRDISGTPMDSSDPTYLLDYGAGSSSNVTITATRTAENDDKDAITGNDLILALRHVAFTITLTADQQRAADVNRNNGVDASDAQFIGQWLAYQPGPACIPANSPNTNCTATWVFNFNPTGTNARDQYTVSSLCAPATVDVKGFFQGDIDGFWPNPFKPSRPSQVGLVLQQVAGEEGEIAVALRADLEREALETLIYSLTYDATALEFAGLSSGSDAPDELFRVDNGAEPGVVHGVAASWKQASTTSGEMLRFRFRKLHATQQPITFSRLLVNDLPATDIPTLQVKDGGEVAAALPVRYSLKASPNPFNPNVRIAYTIPEGAGSVPVQVLVYDIAGRLVRTLVSAQRGPGFHETIWDGRETNGAEARSGLYLVRIQTADWSSVQKVSLVK
jgi:hypothetical protein